MCLFCPSSATKENQFNGSIISMCIPRLCKWIKRISLLWPTSQENPNLLQCHVFLKPIFVQNHANTLKSPPLTFLPNFSNHFHLLLTPLSHLSFLLPSLDLNLYEMRTFQRDIGPRPPDLDTASAFDLSHAPDLWSSTLHSRPPDYYGFTHTSLLATLSSIRIPNSYAQAVQHECWQQAMQEELDALTINHTQDIIPCRTN